MNSATGHSSAIIPPTSKGGDFVLAETLTATETVYPQMSQVLSDLPQFHTSTSANKGSSSGRTFTDAFLVDESAMSHSVSTPPSSPLSPSATTNTTTQAVGKKKSVKLFAPATGHSSAAISARNKRGHSVSAVITLISPSLETARLPVSKTLSAPSWIQALTSRKKKSSSGRTGEHVVEADVSALSNSAGGVPLKTGSQTLGDTSPVA